MDKRRDSWNKKLFSFTLAEILLVIGIIGFVAAMTIPALINSYQKNAAIETIKKEYTSLAQAVKQSESDNGNNADWDWGTGMTARQSFDTYWGPYLRVDIYCTTYTDCGYSSSAPWKVLNNTSAGTTAVSTTSRTSVILSDGSFLLVGIVGGTTNTIMIDINAGKPPNMFGKDVFYLVLDTNKGLMPYGYNLAMTTINSNCATGVAGGNFCLAKIMMDGWQMKSDYPW